MSVTIFSKTTRNFLGGLDEGSLQALQEFSRLIQEKEKQIESFELVSRFMRLNRSYFHGENLVEFWPLLEECIAALNAYQDKNRSDQNYQLFTLKENLLLCAKTIREAKQIASDDLKGFLKKSLQGGQAQIAVYFSQYAEFFSQLLSQHRKQEKKEEGGEPVPKVEDPEPEVEDQSWVSHQLDGVEAQKQELLQIRSKLLDKEKNLEEQKKKLLSMLEVSKEKLEKEKIQFVEEKKRYLRKLRQSQNQSRERDHLWCTGFYKRIQELSEEEFKANRGELIKIHKELGVLLESQGLDSGLVKLLDSIRMSDGLDLLVDLYDQKIHMCESNPNLDESVRKKRADLWRELQRLEVQRFKSYLKQNKD